MRTADFDFFLPDEQIAQQPADPRDSSRLLVLDRETGATAHHVFNELPGLLRPGDLLVRNDTRVMAARLFGRRADTGGNVEILLLRPHEGNEWEALMRPARQARTGRRFVFDASDGPLPAVALERDDDIITLAFERPFDPASVGEVPLPPYITQYYGESERYQTIYNREARSAAAPTAGLHFTPRVLDALRERGVETVDISLDVGPGTFQPVKAEDPREHRMHAEYVTVGEEAARQVAAARHEGRRVIAVGTTVVRTLEHVARDRGAIEPYAGWTSLKLLPGDTFHAVDGLITNFHLPRSTLLMLVCAFAGTEHTLAAYREAVEAGYRFYSFGDAMLIL